MIKTTDIICLVFNNLSLTQRFVHHLFKNTNNFRLIFIDNGSDQDTQKYLNHGKQSGKWHLFRSETNVGVIKGRNIGAKLVESDFFVNLDNDQFVGPGWLDRLHNLLDSGYDVVGSEAWLLTPPSANGKSYYPYKHCSRITDSFSYIGCGGMLIKKYIYDAIGLFDERFNPAYFEDPDFSYSCIKSNYKLGWDHQCPIMHLEHKTMNHQTLFNKNAQFHTSWKKFIEKWSPYYPDPFKMPIKKSSC